MAGVTELIAEAKAAGLSVSLQGEQIAVRGPKSAGAIVQRIRARKDEIRSHLSGSVCRACGKPAPDNAHIPVAGNPAGRICDTDECYARWFHAAFKQWPEWWEGSRTPS